MKKFFLLVVCSLCLFFNSYSQTNENAFKINLSGLAVRNISVQYERQIGERTAIAIALRDVPYGKLPFKSSVAKIVNNPFVQFDKVNVGSFAITPEFRFYFGKQGGLRGFYIGPFVSYSTYKTELPIAYNNKTGLFSGNIKTVTGGLQIGSQFKLTDHLFIDWWIAGPNYGAASGDLVFTGALSPGEQDFLKFELKNLQSDVPLHFIKSYSVDNNGAVIKPGPWAGLRGLGINLAYHF